MDILNDIVGFQWDAGNERKSELKHGVSNAESERVFFNKPLIVIEDEKHSEAECRYHAMGSTDEGRLLHITFCVRDNKIRIISARNIHSKERRIYEQAIKEKT